MNVLLKAIEKLNAADLKHYPVWQYANNDKNSELLVRAVKRIPVDNLNNRIVGSYVTLANGEKVLGILGNIDVKNPRMTDHFVMISVERCGEWFALSRYHDFDYAENGPEALAKFLDLDVDQVFPISYDIRPFVNVGDEASLVGKILREPKERLTRSEIIALAVP